MTETMMLYTNPMSRGRTARWMLEEAGADYDVTVLQFGTDTSSEAFRAINPMGKVPTLKHGDRVVTECAAICTYVADVLPDAGLKPSPEHLAPYFRWIFFASGPMEAAITDRMLGLSIPDDKRSTVGYGNFETAEAALGQAVADVVARDTWLAGPRFSTADVYVGSQIDWGLQFGTITARPEFEAFAARLRERPAYKRANEKDNALMAGAGGS